MPKNFVVWFGEVDKEDIPLVGGKGANLGELTKAGFPVPPGFIITSKAYYNFLDHTKLHDPIRNTLDTLNVNNAKDLEKAAASVQRLITRQRFPKEIASDIFHAYFRLSKGLSHPLVAIRSSATAEDLPTASFAGQQATFLNVWGEANVIEKVKEAWASLFTARAIFYRATNGFDHMKVGIAVPVQRMVASDRSGVMFTIDPVTNNRKRIVVEAIFGLGEMIVQGTVTPDHYEVEKKTLTITGKSVRTQRTMMVRKGRKNRMVPVPKEKQSMQKLTDAEIIALGSLGKRIEHHYFFPQDIEWAIEKGKIFIVQTRPVTTTGKREEESVKRKENSLTLNALNLTLMLKGDPASPGIAAGPVKKLTGARELHIVVPGDVLVAQQTNPDYVPAMRRAVAIVTERGGRTSHAAIVSRELGIPAVVGADGAMKRLSNRLVVTVNGSTGEVYKGSITSNPKSHPPAGGPMTKKSNESLKTATKVYVNVSEPSKATSASKLNVDGVGLLRAEFMIADIGIHPKKIIADRKQKVFIDTLSTHIETFCSSFQPRPVVYRTNDFKTSEYRNLSGGSVFEPQEPNPMLGFRGATRYLADSRVLELELEAIKTVRNKMGYKNLWVMIPYVRTPKELLEVKKIIASRGLLRSPTFKLWLMVEIPTNVIRLDEFLDVGIDGVSIGSNDLTMLLLGTDRDNSEVAHVFSEMDASVLWALERVVKICTKRRVTSSICGQAPSDYPILVEKLVSWGITSISVNPDAVSQVRETIYEAERRLVTNK